MARAKETESASTEAPEADGAADNSGADNSGADNSGADNSGADNSGADNKIPPHNKVPADPWWQRLGRGAALGSILLLVVVVEVSWIAAYVGWVFGSTKWAPRILAPVRWALAHQPSWPLVVLTTCAFSLVLFHKPILDFLTELEDARGFKRRSRQPEETPVITSEGQKKEAPKENQS